MSRSRASQLRRRKRVLTVRPMARANKRRMRAHLNLGNVRTHCDPEAAELIGWMNSWRPLAPTSIRSLLTKPSGALRARAQRARRSIATVYRCGRRTAQDGGPCHGCWMKRNSRVIVAESSRAGRRRGGESRLRGGDLNAGIRYVGAKRFAQVDTSVGGKTGSIPGERI